jgi:hypothetical protein
MKHPHPRLVTLAALASALLPFCLAGHAEDPPLGSRQGLPSYYSQLKLSEAQAMKVRELHSGYREKLRLLWVEADGVRAKERAALEKVLTA